MSVHKKWFGSCLHSHVPSLVFFDLLCQESTIMYSKNSIHEKLSFWELVNAQIHLTVSVFLSWLAGLSQCEGAIILHPHGADGAGCEEVADHPRAGGGDVEGSVCTEGQPLSGVSLWRQPSDSVQGQWTHRCSVRWLSVIDGPFSIWTAWLVIVLVWHWCDNNPKACFMTAFVRVQPAGSLTVIFLVAVQMVDCMFTVSMFMCKLLSTVS